MSATLATRPTLAARIGVTLIFLANGAGYGAWAASIPAIKEGLGVSPGTLGLALLCVAFGAMVAMPVAGWLGTRHVPLLLTGTGALFMAALPLPAFASSVPVLAACLLVLGAGAGSMDVCMNARASRLEQEVGQPIMSSFHAAFALGGLLGTGVVALCSWVGAGALGGLAGTAGLIGAAVSAHAALDRRPDLTGRSQGPALALPSRGVVALGLLCLLAFESEGAVADWSGVFLREYAGYAPSLSGAGFAAFSAAMVLARLAGDGAVRRFGPVVVLRVGAAVAALGMALAAAVPQLGPAGFFLVGLGAANMAPILFSAAGRTGPAVSTGVAAVATLGYAGMLLGPPMIGAAADWIGLREALLLIVAAMAAIALGAGKAAR